MTRTSAPARKAADAYHHGDLRSALVQAALLAVERSGAESVTLGGLAKVLGVSQPAFYRHFADREELLSEVAAKGFRAFAAALRGAMDEAPSGESIERMVTAYVAFGRERSELYRLMFSSRLLVSAAVGSSLREAGSESFELLLEAFEGRGAANQRARSAIGTWMSLHGMLCLEQQGLGAGTGAALDVTKEMLVADIVARSGGSKRRSAKSEA